MQMISSKTIPFLDRFAPRLNELQRRARYLKSTAMYGFLAVVTEDVGMSREYLSAARHHLSQFRLTPHKR